MRRIFISISIFIGFINSVSAASFPFTDVTPTDTYYEGVRALFEYGIITNNGDNLFRPNDPISRDLFVGLATSVSCKQCLIPTTEDIIGYQVSPFFDLSKSNPNYYCIAHAANEGIVQGYILDENGTTSCQNGEKFSSTPFCSENNTSRIEAVAMLLRQSGLWDDTRNINYVSTLNITDISSYWRGYAEKGIKAGILEIQSDGKVLPDELISRGEFAGMASRILSYNQCIPTGTNKSDIASDLVVIDNKGIIQERTVFELGTTDSLGVVGVPGDWERRWTLTNPVTGRILSGTGNTYPLSSVGAGRWIASVDLIDRTTNLVVSNSSSTIVIEGPAEKLNPPLTVNIDATPLSIGVGGTINLSSTVLGGSGSSVYSWNFGDGNTSNIRGNTSHVYNTPGNYTIILTVTDSSGNTSQSSLVVSIGGDIDTDKDGILDIIDICPYVIGVRENNGCPIVITQNYTDSVRNILLGKVQITHKVNNQSGSDILSGISPNACLLRHQSSRGLIIGSPVCDTCPCQSRINILTAIRPCDVVFPTILSPDQNSIYIRGSFYQIP